MIHRPFSEVLREARDARKLTRNQLKQRTGISYERIQIYEEGSSEPRVSDFRKLVQALKVSADYLLGLVPAAPAQEEAQLEVGAAE